MLCIIYLFHNDIFHISINLYKKNIRLFFKLLLILNI